MEYTKELYLSWDEVQANCIELAYKIIATKRRYDAIVAVTRGGMFPAGVLARELDIHYVDTICLSRYNVMEVNDEEQVLKIPQGLQDKSVLVVDDLADKGRTLDMVKEHLPNAIVATIIVKPEGKDRVNVYVRETAQEVWVRFPWDTFRMYRDPVAKTSA